MNWIGPEYKVRVVIEIKLSCWQFRLSSLTFILGSYFHSLDIDGHRSNQWLHKRQMFYGKAGISDEVNAGGLLSTDPDQNISNSI